MLDKGMTFFKIESYITYPRCRAYNKCIAGISELQTTILTFLKAVACIMRLDYILPREQHFSDPNHQSAAMNTDWKNGAGL